MDNHLIVSTSTVFCSWFYIVSHVKHSNDVVMIVSNRKDYFHMIALYLYTVLQQLTITMRNYY